MTSKHGVAMIAEEDLETREEKELHFKKESGENMYLRNRHYGS